MFDFDNFREIWSTIKKNKLRTFLTGFAVSWGIFMLITLLGAGNGLRNGIIFNFRRFSANTVEVWGRYTTMPYKGNPTNRRIEFKEADLSGIKMAFPEIEYCSATISQTDTISYGEEYIVGDLRGVSEDYNSIIYINVASQNGRFINKMDMNATRKVIILSPRMAEVLFRNEDPLGKYVKCGNMMYQVVGIYDDDDKSNNAPAYIPFTVAQQLYNKGFGFGSIYFTVNGVSTEEECKDFENRFRSYMARKHIFDPTDKNAIGMWMTGNEIRMFNTMTDGILLFIWIVGIGTLMAGIVGVSNIMLITVRTDPGVRHPEGDRGETGLDIEACHRRVHHDHRHIRLHRDADGNRVDGANRLWHDDERDEQRFIRRKSRRGSYLIPAPDRQPRDIAGRYRGAGRSRGAGGLFPRSQSRECIRY